MPRALAIVQARMSSTRLPGKALADVEGEPLLALLLHRLRHARELERIIVATSTAPDDDRIEALVTRVGVSVYRGELDDVLARFAGAAGGHRGPLVRLTADCPLLDPGIVDATIRLFANTPGCDYASDVDPRSFPVGLDVEVLSPTVLEWALCAAEGAADREHVTAVIRRCLVKFTSAALVCEEQLGDLHWAVDTAEDLEFVRAVVSRLGQRRHTATFHEVLAAVRQEPSLANFHGRRG